MLTKEQLKVRDFIIKVFKKTIPANKANLRKLAKIHSNMDNKIVVEKYGENLIASFLSKYKFKSKNDFDSVIKIMKEYTYFDTGVSFYSFFNSKIIKKFFDNDTVKKEWLFDSNQTYNENEISNISYYFIRKEKENLLDAIKKILEISGNDKARTAIQLLKKLFNLSNFGNEQVIQYLINIDELKNIQPNDILFQSLVMQYKNTNIKPSIKYILDKWFYEITGNENYLSNEAKDLFIF